MDFVSGRLYFIKDEFFETVGEEYLKMNKEDKQRPHYYAFKDTSTGLLWVIHCSRQVNKYKAIIEKKKKNGKKLPKPIVIRDAENLVKKFIISGGFDID